MNILITGGSGFIGSALIRHIIHHTDHCVINVDKLSYAVHPQALASVSGSPRYHFEHTDICLQDNLERIFSLYRPDAVVHLAAETHVDRSIDSAKAFIQTNLVGTFSMLEATRNYWQRLPENQRHAFRFLHVSTDEVYGDLGNSNTLFTETTPYAPSNPYSASKAGSDHLVRAWQRTYGISTLITHSSNNYGPYQFPEKLIPLTLARALSGKPVPLYGNGQQIRDWIFVEDHARALYRILTQSPAGQSYNIGGNCEKTNLEVVRTLCRLLDELAPEKPQNIKHYEDLITFTADRPGHDTRYASDTAKIRQTLGWQPSESFESGLRKTVEWHLQFHHNQLFQAA